MRPHECYQLHWELFESKQCVRTDKSTKTGERVAFPLPADWVTVMNIRPGMELPPLMEVNFWNGKETPLEPGNKNYGRAITHAFNGCNAIKFNAYDLRHAYALRTIKKGMKPAIASKLMGHSLQIHSQVYHRHLSLTQLEEEMAMI